MAEPLTTNELKRNGSFRADKHGGGLQAAGIIGDCPEGFNIVEREVWQVVVNSIGAEALRSIDRFALEGACRWFAKWKLYMLELDSDDGGNAYKLMVQAGTAWKHFSTTAAKLGLTPADRAKMRIEAHQTTTDELRFFGG